MAKTKTPKRTYEAEPAFKLGGTLAPTTEVLLGVPDAIDRAADNARKAQVAREACAGTRVLEAVARDAAGLGWSFTPYAPDSDASREGRGWRGWFTVGGRRLCVRVGLEGESEDPRVEALEAEVEDLTEKVAGLEEERDDAVKDVELLKDEVAALKKEVKEHEDRYDALFPLLSLATDTEPDLAAIKVAAAKVPKAYLP